ncbi:MAG: sigma 54-interacting transcriptional regulator [Planctomycetes bacterium]|nr:sigma 54-interacting transcriptional regulator [Planctomycetota bacterium]
MTTALITQGTLTGKARVAWVSRQAGEHIASLVQRAGHELVECSDWGALRQADAGCRCDLVLCDEESLGELSSGVMQPLLVVTDRVGPELSVATISSQALEQSAPALLALALQAGHSAQRLRELERLTSGIRSGQALIGNSPVVRRLHGTLSRAADCDATVLIEGPNGAGKSLAARIIHCKSRRSGQALVCADGAASTAESLGRTLDAAKGSTLVIEDIDRLPATAQAQLVRFLKDRSASSSTAPRLVVTTAAHLPELVARGAFREDLYYRLHAFPIVVPSLRERVEDIALIANAVLESGNSATARTTPGMTAAAQLLIESMPWPGNVTQLEAAIRRAQLAASGGTIDREHLLVSPPAAPKAAPGNAVPVTGNSAEGDDAGEDGIRPFEEEEQRLLTRALRATKGNVRRAAQLLGIGRATLYRKIQQYQLRLQ